MDNKLRAYIAGTGTITSAGGDSAMNYHSVKAGINCFRSADYFTQNRERMSMALVPEGALPPLLDELNVRGKISFRYRRVLRMCHVAATQAMLEYKGEPPVPLIFSAPTNDFGLTEQFPEHFFQYLIQQSGLPIDAANSRLIFTGRTGVLDALDLALRYMYEAGFETVLIGGGDSCQNSELLKALDKKGRIHAPGVMDGFTPGEGAGFILLTANPQIAQCSGTHIPSLLIPGFGSEAGHWFSEQAYKGDGLAQAFHRTLSNYASNNTINTIYSSMNGENFWAKEYGVAMVRNQKYFTDNCRIQHPSDCYGDLGAATGAVLINLAAYDVVNGGHVTPDLIYCSSDHNYRAATCLEALPLSSALQPPKTQAHAMNMSNKS